MKHWIEENLDGGKVVKESLAGSSSWSSAYTYHTESGKKYFVKLSPGRDSSMFEGEALGLQALYGVYLHYLLTHDRSCKNTTDFVVQMLNQCVYPRFTILALSPLFQKVRQIAYWSA